jgi:hypothetical protein
MSTKSTEAADAVDRAARGEAAPPTPVRAQRSRKSAPAGDSHPAPESNDTLDARIRALEQQVGIEGGHRSLLTKALEKLRAEFSAYAQATVDQWVELEGRVSSLEADRKRLLSVEERVGDVSDLREADVLRELDLVRRVAELEADSPEEVTSVEEHAALRAQVGDLHRQVQALQGQQRVQPAQLHPLLPVTSFWGKRLPRLRLG